MSILEIDSDLTTPGVTVTLAAEAEHDAAEPSQPQSDVPGTQPDQPMIDGEGPTPEANSAEGDAPPAPILGNRPTFTITDAATACGVSRKTITRKLSDLATHGAAKDDDGVWRIPVEALLAVGLHPGRSLPPSSGRSAAPSAQASPAPATTRAQPSAAPVTAAAQRLQAPELSHPDVVTVPRDRWDDLRLRLAKAEAEAAERASALADARLALRALTAVPHTPSPPAVPATQPVAWAGPPAGAPTAVAAEEPAQPAKKCRWWQSGY